MPPKTRALQLNIEGLFKLLGGSPSDREKFWEKIIGVTTPAEIKLINGQLTSLAAHVKAVEAGTKALSDSAQQIAKRG